MMEETNEWVSDGNAILKMKIVRDFQECDNDDNFFNPDMCHQVFGQNETVYGYKKLNIKLIYDALNFYCWLDTSYTDKAKPDPVSGLEPDDFVEKLKRWIPEDYVSTKDEFQNKIDNSIPQVFGKIISEFKVDDREFQIRFVVPDTPGYEEFHQRMETLIVWFIDAANFIDVEDKKWRFYVVYEKVTKNDKDYYYALGYSSVYCYFYFPSSVRFRISQFIIFNPYQNMGLGTELLKALYQELKSVDNVHDITVEEPSEKFQTLRDFVDIELCRTLPCFDPKILKNGFNKTMIKEAKDAFNLNDKQIRRIYEILRLAETDTKNPQEYRKYEAMVKQRLGAPFARQERAKKRKLFNTGLPMLDEKEYERQQNIIETQYNLLIENYNHVIDKLSKAQH